MLPPSGFRRYLLVAILAGLVRGLGSEDAARAGPITFNFDTNSLHDPLAHLNPNSSNVAISRALTNVLSATNQGASVTVTGAAIQNTYSGNGHVVGPTFSSHRRMTPVAWTLGDSTYTYNTQRGTLALSPPSSIPARHGYGNFLSNNSSRDDTTITMTFKHFLVGSITFAFEIFPDASEQGSRHPADFTFQGGKMVGRTFHSVKMRSFTVTSAYPTLPASPTMSGHNVSSWTVLAVPPGLHTTEYLHSPNSGRRTEQSAQFLGVATVVFQQPVSVLEFQDWPAMIGINDLVLNPVPFGAAAPAPPSAVLFGLGSLGLLAGLIRSRRRPLLAA